MNQPKILVVDDDASVRYTLEAILRDASHEVTHAANGLEAKEHLANDQLDLVLTDLAMPECDGMSLLQFIRLQHPHIPTIMLTAQGSERSAVEAMKAGAWDYLTKPFDLDELLLSVDKALERFSLVNENQALRAQRTLSRPIVYRSEKMADLMRLTHRAAQRDVTVLITGETGTGKELIASALYELSTRAHQPFVTCNASVLPEGLAESHLFGHEKGAFTGAHQRHIGLFEQADGGTLFLDEIGDLPLALQVKLLRVLQEGEFQRVGGRERLQADVRVIAATHHNLREEVRAGRFREDLFYRLNVVELYLPPLRDRPDDIPFLCQHFFARYKERFGLTDLHVPAALTEGLQQRDWPGNIRQLEHAIERLLALSDGIALHLDDLACLDAPSSPHSSIDDENLPLRQRVAAFEALLIEQALEQEDGNRSAAARTLQVSRITLHDKIKKYGLS